MDAVTNYITDCFVHRIIAPNEETAAQLAQACCKAQAAFDSYMADMLSVVKETSTQAEEMLARLQEEHLRAHAMVSATPSTSTAAFTVVCIQTGARHSKSLSSLPASLAHVAECKTL